MLMLPLLATVTSCGLINEDLEPCVHEYRLKFKYDYNAVGGDAFASQVTSVRAWVYDKSGKLVTTVADKGAALQEEDYSLPLTIPPGEYDILAWCGLESGGSFMLSAGGDNPAMTSLGTELKLMTRSGSLLYSSEELTPLFHGFLEGVKFTSPEGENTTQYATVSLVKDTNRIAVSLVQVDGTPVGRGDFKVCIEGANSLLNWDNKVMEGPEFDYIPWASKVSEAQTNVPSTGDNAGVLHSVLWELSTSRLMADRHPMLSITRTLDNKEIVRIDLIKYLLWVKGEYKKEWGEQEYLDRVDNYTMTFFIDSDHNWYKAVGIYINGWAVVPEQDAPL